jgi:hypothetical protein
MLIDSLETEDRRQLTKLKNRVWDMKDLSEVLAMRSEIEGRLQGAHPPPGVEALLGTLELKAGEFKTQARESPVGPAFEPVVSPPERSVASREKKEPSSAAGIPETRTFGRSPQQEGSSVSARVEAKEPLADQPGRTAELTLASAVPPKSQGPAAVNDMTTSGETLRKRAAELTGQASKLKDDPTSGGPEAIQLTSPRPPRGLRDLIFDIRNHHFELKRRIDELRNIEQQQKSKYQDTVIAERKAEVTAGRALLGQYIENLRIDVVGLPEPVIPKLLFGWIFTSAFRQATVRSSSNRWIAGLLAHLKVLNAAGPGRGPQVVVVGTDKSKGPAGQGRAGYIEVEIDLVNKRPLEVLTSDDALYKGVRDELVTETASSFLHEAAHSLQDTRYDNSSYPWERSRSPGSISKFGWVRAGFLPSELPVEVLSALQEFIDGGDQTVQEPEHVAAWKRIQGNLHAPNYYVLDPRVEGDAEFKKKNLLGRSSHLEAAAENRKKYPAFDSMTDIRAKELVSHLIEVAYAFNDVEKFRAAFPRGADLLDKVIGS